MQTQWYAAYSGPAVLRPAFGGILSGILKTSLLALSLLRNPLSNDLSGDKARCPRQHSGGIAHVLLETREAPQASMICVMKPN